MTDLNTHAGTNGAAPPPAPSSTKKRVATSSIEGTVGRIKFSSDHGDAVVEVDFTKIAPSIQSLVGAYGAVNILQTAYNASEHPVEAAKAALKKLMNGEWRPGIPRGTAEPDPLVAALAEHLDKDHAYVETVYIPAYQEKHGLDTPAAARRKLRAHPVVAQKVAAIMAARAAKAAQAARKAPADDLAV